MSEHKQVYWDDEKKLFYWIEWIDIGTADIPIKHYIINLLLYPIRVNKVFI